VFARGKIASGINGVRHLYVSNGYVDWRASSDARKFSDAAFVVTLAIIEGPQYRMGKLDIFAKKELAEKLRAAWELPEGAVFDYEYLSKYVDSNRALLPPEFVRKDVQLVRDCPDSTVEIRLPIDGTEPGSQSQPKDIECMN